MDIETQLRALEAADLDDVFTIMSEPDAVAMAAFTAEDPSDRAAFDAHMQRVLGNPQVKNWVITDRAGRFVGTIAIFPSEADVPEVTYWISQSQWGKGHASRALALALHGAPRPVLARAAADNARSLHILRKAGFVVIDKGRDYAPGRRAELDEFVLELR